MITVLSPGVLQGLLGGLKTFIETFNLKVKRFLALKNFLFNSHKKYRFEGLPLDELRNVMK